MSILDAAKKTVLLNTWKIDRNRMKLHVEEVDADEYAAISGAFLVAGHIGRGAGKKIFFFFF